MIEDKDMFAWKNAIREPVDKKTLPLAVKTASLIGHNIYKCLRCQKKLGFCCAYDVPYDNTLSFRKTDDCKAFMLYDDDIIIGVITLNVFHGISKRDMSLNFDTDRYKTTTNAIVCLSHDNDCVYCASLIMFSNAFLPGELSDYLKDWKLPINDSIVPDLFRLSAKYTERMYHLETAEEFNFEERD